MSHLGIDSSTPTPQFQKKQKNPSFIISTTTTDDDQRFMRKREMAEREVREDVNEESRKNNEDLETNSSSVLAGLNLVMILSSLSSSDEQRLSVEEIEERESGNKGKNSGSRSRGFPTRRQQTSGFSRAVEKQQMSKIQTKMRDCRHCRRL